MYEVYLKSAQALEDYVLKKSVKPVIVVVAARTWKIRGLGPTSMMSFAPPAYLPAILDSFPMPVAPIPRRTSSEITHVSDSEPEEEACRRRQAQFSPLPDSPPAQRTPLAAISNTFLRTEPIGKRTIETRLSRLEEEITEIKHLLTHGKRNRSTQSPPYTPLRKRRRITDNEATPETPILRSSLMVSTPERDEMARDLARYVSEGVQQTLRESHGRNLERDSVMGTSGMRKKLRRRAHE
ncbi:hypothetical protein C8R44DRAFT_858032 [Mycena epipterygia]|nr:hypothetical protein C8R44DRAFT_858032 [Mycena epipterygia]